MNPVHFLSISQTAFKQKMTKLYNHKMTATAGTWNWEAVDGESCDNIAPQIFLTARVCGNLKYEETLDDGCLL